MLRFLSLFVIAAIATGQLYNTSLFSPGANLIVNPTFSTPDIGGVMTQYYTPGGISGWTFPNGQIVTISTLCTFFVGSPCLTNATQGFDLDVSFFYELLSQAVSITNSAQYLLTVEWLEAVVSPIGKSFEIKINSTSLANITITTNNYTGNVNQYIVNGNPGLMNISFQQFGAPPDGLGPLMTGIYLQELLPIGAPPPPPPPPVVPPVVPPAVPQST